MLTTRVVGAGVVVLHLFCLPAKCRSKRINRPDPALLPPGVYMCEKKRLRLSPGVAIYLRKRDHPPTFEIAPGNCLP